MARLSITSVSAVNATGLNTSYTISITWKNESSSSTYRRHSIKMEWINSSGAVIGTQWLAGSSATQSGSVSCTATPEGKQYKADYSFIPSRAGLTAGSIATSVRISVYTWISSDDSTPYGSATITTNNVTFIGETHNLTLISANASRNGNTVTISFNGTHTYSSSNQYKDKYIVTATGYSRNGEITTTGTNVAYSVSLTDTVPTTSSKTYTIEVYNDIGDRVTKQVAVYSSGCSLHLHGSENGGVGIGRSAIEGQLDVAYPSNFEKNINILGNATFSGGISNIQFGVTNGVLINKESAYDGEVVFNRPFANKPIVLITSIVTTNDARGNSYACITSSDNNGFNYAIMNNSSSVNRTFGINWLAFDFTTSKIVPVVFLQRGYIAKANGVSTDSATSAYKYSDYIDISEYSSLNYTCPTVTLASGSVGAIVFYNSSKTYISGVFIEYGSSQVGYVSKSTTIPNGAKYARVSGLYANTYGEYNMIGYM